MAGRAKAKAVARNGKVSLCILDETWPFAYLQVYRDAVIDDDDETLIDVMMAVAERMSGEPVPVELRPAVKAVAEQEGRVLLRCRPYATFVTPPRHLHSNDQQELTHWVSASMPCGRAMLDQALAHGIESVPDAPASMVRLFEEFEKDPPWVDHDLVERGAFLFRRCGPAVFSFQGVGTLLAYTENPIVQPLSMTGKYAGDAALNRFMETARFWIDVSDPGGTKPGAPGRATAMRVRIMHVFLRHRITRHPQWNLEAWGKPINQAEATITLLSGGFATGLGMHKLGYRSTTADTAAMMHFWRYVGHLMGVQPRWYPADLREAGQLTTLYFAKRAFGAGDDGRELIESYPRAFTPKEGTGRRKGIRDQFNYRIQLGYTRYFLPGRFYRSYDMPGPWPSALLPPLQIPINLTVDLLAHRSARIARLQDRFARWRRNTWFRNEMGDRDAYFKAAETFRR